MNLVIEYNKDTYALLSEISNVSGNNKTEWFGKETQPLQGSRMNYDKGKSFKTHIHKLNPRIINYTQEAFVVISGKIQIDIYEKENNVTLQLGSLVASSGDVIFVWKGYHKLSILEDNTVCYEIKAGQFTSVSQDKEFLPDVD